MARGAKKEIALTPEEKLAQALVPEAEQPYRVPENWKWVRLGTLGYTNIGLTYKPSDKSDEGTIVLRSCNILDGRMVYDDIVKVSIDVPENKMSKKGDILICARNGSKSLVGKTAIIDDDGMSYGAFMAIFRSPYNKYVYYYLNSHYFRGIIDRDVGTTTINQVTQQIIKELPFPFAPLAEQKRIVDRIENLFAKLDEAKEKAQAVVDGFEDRKAAILHKAFTGELTERWRIGKQITLDSWHAKRLSETSITIIDGDRGKNYPKKEEFSPDGYCIFLNAKNVTKRGFVFDEVECITKEKDELLHNGRLKRGDMVMTTRGTIGNVAVYDDSVPYEHLRINSGMVIYRGGIEFIKQYLIWLYQSKLITTQIDNLRTGTAQPQLPIKVMNALVLPIPTIEEQKEIVETLNKLITKEQQAKAVAEQVIDQIDTMKKAILARAFRGELGTNDPMEESAEGLLKAN